VPFWPKIELWQGGSETDCGSLGWCVGLPTEWKPIIVEEFETLLSLNLKTKPELDIYPALDETAKFLFENSLKVNVNGRSSEFRPGQDGQEKSFK
jgi:hypothetical protein